MGGGFDDYARFRRSNSADSQLLVLFGRLNYSAGNVGSEKLINLTENIYLQKLDLFEILVKNPNSGIS